MKCNINSKFFTTKICYKLLNNNYLDENGKIKEEYKFKLNFPEFGIVDSKIPAKENEKFDTLLFLPEGENRKGEGGLRTKGYFKFSYEKKDGKWWIVKDEKFIEEIDLNEEIVKGYNKLPLVTIVTVVYNGEKYLEETIQSVINQTYPNVEYIIIDGGSTDKTLDIIRKYEDKIDYWISERDRNMYDAINKGIKLAKGEVIASLNSDDLYYDNYVIRDIIKFFDKNFFCEGIYGNIVKLDELSKNTKVRKTFQINFEDLLFSKHSTFMPQPTMFLKKNIYLENLYKISYNYASDYEFNLRILKKNYKICFFDRIITVFRQHKESITSSGKLEEERKKILKEYDFFKLNFCKRTYLYIYNWIKYKFKNIKL